YRVEHTGDGRLKITIDIVDTQPVDISFPGLASIPQTWSARIGVHLQQYASGLRVTAFPDEPGAVTNTLASAQLAASFRQSACDITVHDLALRVQTQVPGEYTIVVAPLLEP